MPKVHTLGDFHKLALSVTDKACRKALLSMHKRFQFQHGCSTSQTPLLPRNISNMFAKYGNVLNVRDVRAHPQLFTFVKWYGRNDIIRRLSKKDLGQWLDLCVNTLGHICGFISDQHGIRKWFLLYLRGECPGLLSGKQQFCLQHTLMCGKSQSVHISDAVFAETVEFIDCVVGVSKQQHQQDRWLQTSLSFCSAPRFINLCDWSRSILCSLFHPKLIFVVVILFKQHVQVFRTAGRRASVAMIIRAKNDHTCNFAIAQKLRDLNLLDRVPFYINVLLCKQQGLYLV